MANGFTEGLMEWHRRVNDRAMPWKGEKDPYKVWLSEVILQQTRVELQQTQQAAAPCELYSEAA